MRQMHGAGSNMKSIDLSDILPRGINVFTEKKKMSCGEN